MKKITITIALAAALLTGAWTARAVTSDNLQHLAMTGGTLTIGDKTFGNFSFNASNLTNFDPSQITVTASIQGGVYYLTYGGNMSLINGGTATADLLLNYTVTAAQGLINMIDQYYAGSANGDGTFLAVDEVVRNQQGNVVANSHLDRKDLSDPFGETGDNLDINPALSFLRVTKDISFGVTNGGFVTITEVAQSFHQVPEASTMALLALGVLPVAVQVLRRKQGRK